MHRATLVLLVLLGMLLSAGAAPAIDIDELMERHIEAMGGRSALESIESSHTVAKLSMAGMEGKSVSYFEIPNKYRDEIILPIATITRIANGDQFWTVDMGGQLRRMTGEEVEEIRTSVFLASGEYLEEKHRGSAVQYLGDESTEGVSYHKLLIQPEGGLEMILHIDPETYLISFGDAEIQMFSVRTYQSDYREIDGVMVPFELRQDAGVPQLNADITVIEHEFNIDPADSLFEPQTQEKRRAYIMDGDRETIRFRLRSSHVYVPVMINGKGPYSFVLDSGAGLSLVGRKAADELGLPKTGELPAVGTGGVDIGTFVTADSISVGSAVLKEIVAGQLDFSNLNQFAQEPIEGILGYDFFSNFIVELNYFDSTVTFMDQSLASELSADDTIAIEIETNHPMIAATINDSIVGRFRVDTGSMNYVDFNTHFVAEHNLIERSESTIPGVKIHGVGGDELETILGRVDKFTIGEFTIEKLPCGFSTSESGIFAAQANDGNIGGGVLSKFTCTFDYANERLLIEPNDNFGAGDDMVSAGVVLGKVDGTVIVSQVLDGSSAHEEDIAVGDTVLTVDGQDVRNMELFELHELLNAEESDEVTLEIAGSDGTRIVTLKKKSLF